MLGNIFSTKTLSGKLPAIWQNFVSFGWHKIRRNKQKALRVRTGQVDYYAPGC